MNKKTRLKVYEKCGGHCAYCGEAITELKRENERIKKFNAELVKDCKWLCTQFTPEINGFETIVLCKNGKKRVAAFRNFDLRWYDVNNGDKLNVIKWLWQPTMPVEKEMKCDELKVQKIGDLCFDFKMGKKITPNYYRKSEVDEAIAELKAENEALKKELEYYHGEVNWEYL